MKKKVTIRDIAAQLGLSAMTVSLALRDHPRISAPTKERIRAAMKELQYEPNQVARALATGKSNLIGVIVPNSSDPYYAEVIRAIEDAASAAGYHVLLANGSYQMERYSERVKDMIALHMRGIIAAPPFISEKPTLPPFWQDLLHSDFDVVLVNRQLQPPIFHQVAADYQDGVRMVVEKLVALGHHRVAYLSGQPAMLPIRQRRAAFQRWAKKYDLDPDPQLFADTDLSFRGGYEAGQGLWARLKKKPTAVVTFSDAVAVGLLRWLDVAGVAVPQQVSVISFDGTVASEFTHPTLSTVYTPMYEIGQRAFRLLAGAMANEYCTPQNVILPVEVKARESLGPAPAQTKRAARPAARFR
ncbi:MAG: LacI family DNA-binding transcriptional regulator [Blastocatellia bacterium]